MDARLSVENHVKRNKKNPYKVDDFTLSSNWLGTFSLKLNFGNFNGRLFYVGELRMVIELESQLSLQR